MIEGLLAAILFGVSAPLTKLLLVRIDPLTLAGLLYLGAGAGVGALLAIAMLCSSSGRTREARLERADLPWLAGAALTGGVAGPILLLVGLQRTAAATASLLLNFEVAATGLVASLLFRESVGRLTWWAIGTVTFGGVLLSLDPSAGWGISVGALLIVGACLMWGLDNNLTQRISLRDPKRIAAIKGLAAGTFSVLLARALGKPFPAALDAIAALCVGAVSYGLSIVLFVRSLRHLGAARTGALFGIAPFAGVALSLVVLREVPQVTFFLALPPMILAATLLALETHDHLHGHVAETHRHAHSHRDPHHDHKHAEAIPRGAVHAHRHTHDATEHAHFHRPDAHHRHRHTADAK